MSSVKRVTSSRFLEIHDHSGVITHLDVVSEDRSNRDNTCLPEDDAALPAGLDKGDRWEALQSLADILDDM